MNLEQITLADVVAFLAIAGVFYHTVTKIATMELKVDTIWTFLLKRGVAETVQGGFATMNSPLLINERGLSAMKPLIPDLKLFAKTLKRKMSDGEIMMTIERKFGERLFKEVCIPNNMHLGACLVVALAIVKQPNQVTSEAYTPLQLSV